MRKIYRYAIGLLLMGTILFPGCDEGGGDTKDLLPLILLNNSQYYIEFDADYDNVPGVDAHVKMGVRSHFKIDPDLDRYVATFSGNNNVIAINLPDSTSDDTYDESSDSFYFSYHYFKKNYGVEIDHNFTFDIKQWDSLGKEAYADFFGEISDNDILNEQVIEISNGKLYARILD